MSGNASEYCWDKYVEGWYKHAATVDPTGPVDDYGRGDKVARGGSWFWAEKYMRIESRGTGGQRAYSSRTGFRLVRTVTTG
jgi:formylglycine-generating enzyme required for sulfatase activity